MKNIKLYKIETMYPDFDKLMNETKQIENK